MGKNDDSKYDYDFLNRSFVYDPETGIITIKDRPPEDFKGSDNPEYSAEVYNRLHGGRRALCTWRDKDRSYGGYLQGARLAAARVAWVLGHEGKKPLPTRMRFVDGDKGNFKLENLK